MQKHTPVGKAIFPVHKENVRWEWRQALSDVGLSLWCPPAGRVDSVVIDSDVTNYTLSSLFPATEYEISLNAVRGSQESKVVSTSVFTGRSWSGERC